MKHLGLKPCALCGGRAEAIGQFQPEDPAAFGCPSGHAVYFPICRGCLKTLDLDFLEAHLLHCGHQTRPEAGKLTRRMDG